MEDYAISGSTALDTSAARAGGRTFHVIFNARAGAALGIAPERLRESFAQAGQAAFLDEESPDDLDSQIERALASDASVIVSAGGDGTATAIANRLIGSDKTLAILPLGTANLLARDLGLPLDLDGAVAALATATEKQIDVGEVNGRMFLHKVVIGVIPAIAAVREKVRGQNDLRTVFRFARYVLKHIRNGRRTAVSIVSRDTMERIARVRAIAVANNAYDEGWAQVFHRSRLDAGCLTLYVLNRLSVGDILRLSAEMIAGNWRGDEAISIDTVRSVTLNAKRASLSVMIDGEVEHLPPPLNFTIRPAALRVLVPVSEKTQADAETGDDDRTAA